MRTAEETLAAVDAALAAGGPTSDDPAEAELQALALALAEDAPAPEPRFAEAMDAWAAGGFARGTAPRAARPGATGAHGSAGERLRARLAGALATREARGRLAGIAASAVLATVIGVSIATAPGDGGNDDSGGGEAAAPAQLEAPEDRSARALGEADEGAGGGGAAPAPPGAATAPAPADESFASGRSQRRVEHSAQVELAAPEERVDEVASGVARVADRHRGFVLRSSVATGERAGEGGSFELRIPQARLRAALTDLARLGTLRSSAVQSEDVTRAHVSVGDRLAAARAERRSLLRRLERAGSDAEAAAIRRRLDRVAREVDRHSARLRALRERAAYASVAVTLEVEDEEDGSGGGTGEALDDALGSLVGALNLSLRVLGVLLPIALLGGVAALVARAVRRRRREAALG